MPTVITGQVDQTVVLGQAGYGNAVTVARSGSIVPIYSSANTYYGGIYIPASVIAARVTNHGSVGATYGYGSNEGGNGGVGVHFATSGYLSNTGAIVGGTGGSGSYVDGPGGDGVEFKGTGDVVNSGVILGGNAGPHNSQVAGTQGGVGIRFSGHASLVNSGMISGGEGNGGQGAYGGAGGNGIDLLASGQLSNTGTISGGAAGSTVYQPHSSGAGVYLAGAGTLINWGVVTGGAGGAATKSRSGYREAGGLGGVGVDVADGSHLANKGTILGGAGGQSLVLGGYGADGVDATGLGTVSNAGTIIGGAGGPVSPGANGGEGGAGVSVAGGSRLNNTGVILGGAGGGSPQFGGRAGSGVDLSGGSMVTNSGTITGGLGGAGYPGKLDAGYGGVGVFLDGGTLVNAGVIVGGHAGTGGGQQLRSGLAVTFGQATSTLVVDPGAVFTGGIAGYRFADDTLVLAGNSPGSLSGFGTSITGLTTIREDAHAIWTLGGSITGTGSIQIGAGATLTLGGAVSVPTIAFLGGGGETLRLGMPANVRSTLQGFASGDVIDVEKTHATSLTYANGTLTLYDGQSVVDTLRLLGHYTPADFSLRPDGHTGTDVVFAAMSYTDLTRTLFDRITANFHGHLPL